MSFASAFTTLHLQIQRDQVEVSTDANKLLSQSAPIVLIQMAARVLVPLSTTHANDRGDFQHRGNEVAYNVMTLIALESVPFMDLLKDDIHSAIKMLRNTLAELRTNKTSQKTIALILAATEKQPLERLLLEEVAQSRSTRETMKQARFVDYFAKADFMNGESPIAIKAAILEGSYYTALLRNARSDIFPLTMSKERDKYLEYIPPMFTLQSTYFEGCTPPQWLYDIMLWSMYIFVVDEFMEAEVVHFSSMELDAFRKGLEMIHPDPDPRTSIIEAPHLRAENADQCAECLADISCSRVRDAVSTCYSWATWVMNWDSLARATPSDMNELRMQVKRYLLCHVYQIEDNVRFAAQLGRDPTSRQEDAQLACFDSPRSSYVSWVHTVGAGHISAPISLSMAACYMGSWVRHGQRGWSSMMQQMVAYETNIHVAAYCRIYNDYGSVTRDVVECNLNSVNFPEFWTNSAGRPTDGEQNPVALQEMKSTLLELGKHERRMAEFAADQFYQTLQDEGTTAGKAIASAMRVYFRSGELFSDMYLTRDVTNTVK